jgi:hypothetical protein
VKVRPLASTTAAAKMSAALARIAGAAAAAALATFVMWPTPIWASARAARRFACSKANSAKVPCRFSTPSGNVRCEWTPSPDSVACVLLASGRAYRLRPSGKAKAIHLSLRSRGETLPTYQQIVFPHSLSCRDTNATMTCNQDFGAGFFKLSPKGSRSG